MERTRIDLTLPTCWGDLTLQQLRTVVEVLLMSLTDEERLVLLFFRLSGVKTLGAKTSGFQFCVTSDGKKFAIKDWELAAFSGMLRWVIATEPDVLPNPTAAEDCLRDMSFEDWFETDMHLRMYEQDGDLSHFDIIMARLEGKARKVDATEAMMIRMWWVSLSNRLADMYPNAFEKHSVGEGGSYNPFKSLQDIHLLLNDDRPQENGRIDESNLHDVLAALDSRIGKMKRRKTELERIRR